MTIYKICFYVPPSHAEMVKNAIFTAGAGKIGPYSHCCWQTLGEGQFMPLPGSDPYLGTVDTLEKVAEYKIELACDAENIHQVIAALKESHPYEEPAYQVLALEEF